MRTKRLLSLVMAFFMLFTLTAPTFAWALEGDGNDGAATTGGTETGTEPGTETGDAEPGTETGDAEPGTETGDAEPGNTENPPAAVAAVDGEDYADFGKALAAALEFSKVLELKANAAETVTLQAGQKLLVKAGEYKITVQAAEGCTLAASEPDEDGVVTYEAKAEQPGEEKKDEEPKRDGAKGTTQQAVAQIGETKFETLAAAFAALANGGTLTLLQDAAMGANVTLPANATITILLDHHEITDGYSIIVPETTKVVADVITNRFVAPAGYLIDWATTDNHYTYTITKSSMPASVTHGDTATDYETASGAMQAARNGDTVTLNESVTENLNLKATDKNGVSGGSVTLDMNGYTVSGTITSAGGSTLTITGNGTVNAGQYGKALNANGGQGAIVVTNGTFSGKYAAVSDPGYNDTSATLTINGGTFNGTTAAILVEKAGGSRTNGGSITVNAGTFNGPIVVNVGSLVIYGGTFDHDPSDYVAAGYEATKSGDVWNVAKYVPAIVEETNNATELTATIENGVFTASATESVAIAGQAATVSFNADAVKALANAGALTLSVAVADGQNDAKLYTITLNGNNGNVFTSASGNAKATITVPFTVAQGKLPKVFLKDGDTLTPVAVTGYTDSTVTFEVPHFSQYEVSQQDATVSVTASGETKYYDDLAYAISQAASGSTITLLDNVTLAAPMDLALAGKAITFDLGGNTLTGRTNLKSGSLTIQNGTVAGGDKQALNVYGSNDSSATNYSVLTIASNVTVTADQFGVCLFGNAYNTNGYGAVINITGTVHTQGNGAEGAVFVSGNLGNNVSGDANNVINVTGTIISYNDAAIALNGLATVNVQNGASVTGNTAIAVKRGTLNVTGGTVHATGARVNEPAANNSGTEMTGAAISVTGTYNNYGDLAVNISGGTVTSDHADALYRKDDTYPNPANYSVSGGTFSSPVPASFCAPGYEPKDLGSGNYGVDTIKVAQIGSTKYETLAAAVAAAQSGDTITLLTDVTLTERLFVNAGATPSYAGTGNRYATTSENKAITLDLNGHNITSSSNIALAGGSLNITGSGTISTTGSGLAPIEIRGTGDLTSKRTLTIGANVVLNGAEYGLNVFGSNDAQKNIIDVTVHGTVHGTLFVLGNLKNTANEINIVVDGTIAAPNAQGDDTPNQGIALNGNANVTVNAGANISGDSGIEVRAGSLTVKGGTIKGTATPYSVNAEESGCTTKGAAIAVAQHTTKLITVVTVSSSANLTGTKHLSVADPQNNGMEDVEVAVPAALAADTGTVIPAGYMWVETATPGTYEIAQAVASITIGGQTTLYASLEAAVAAAADGDTITLLDNVTSDSRFSITKSLTIDGQGHTIAVNNIDNRVIDISETSNVTLTLKNVTIDGSNVKVDSAYPRGISLYGNTNVKLVLDNATVSAGHYAINVAGANYGVDIEIKNSSVASGWAALNVWSPSTITVTGSELSGTNNKTFNGDGWNNFSTVVLNDGAQGSSLSFTNTKITSAMSTGNSQWFVDVRSGSATITFTDCDFEQTGTPTNDDKHPDAMFAVRGNGISAVTFTGCDFKKDNVSVDDTEALFEKTRFYSYPALYSNYVIDGVQYVVGTDGNVLRAEPDTVTRDEDYNVIAGTFYADSDPTATLAEGYIAIHNANGTYTVGGPYVATLTHEGTVTGYASLKAAVTDAADGDTITLLANATGGGLFIGPNRFATNGLTIDFNGKTYTVEDPPVGSSGTENQALHFESGNKITLTGGTINMTNDATALAAFEMFMQNYGTLVIDTMTIDGTGIAIATYSDQKYQKYPEWYNTEKPQFNYNTAGTSVIRNSTITMPGALGVDDAAVLNIEDDAIINVSAIATNGTDARYTGTSAVSVENGATFTLTGNGAVTAFETYLETKGQSLGTAVDGVYTVRAASYVAQIGTGTDAVKYESLAAAIADVPTDGTQTTITMIADEAVVAGVTIAAGKNIVLELNGKTISGNTDSTTTYALITNRGTLTIQDNTDTNKDGTGSGLITTYISNPDTGDVPGYASNTITNNGTLTVKSGKIVNNGSGYACYAIDNQTNGNSYTPVLNIEGGRMQQMNDYTYAVRMFCNSTTKDNTVNVSGGVIEGGYGLWLQSPNANANKAQLTITDGTIDARDGYALFIGGTKADRSENEISISGGYIKGLGVGIQNPLSGTYGHVEISGGKFNGVSAGANVEGFIKGGEFAEVPNEAYIAEGYIASEKPIGDTYPIIIGGPYEAAIGNTGYTTLAAAVEAASAGDTITLLANVEQTTVIGLTKNLTLDLNGKTINGQNQNNGSWIRVTNNAILTINGTGATVYGRIELGVATNDNGNVVINGGTYIRNNGTVLHINGTCLDSDVTITGATITSNGDNGLQLLGKGTFTITGSTISGETAIYLKAGELTVTNSTVTSTANSHTAYTYNGNGANATGDAIVVDSCNYPGGAPTLTLGAGNTISVAQNSGNVQIGYYEYNTDAAGYQSGTVTAKSDAITIPADYKWVETETAGTYKLVEAVVVTFNLNGGTYNNSQDDYLVYVAPGDVVSALVPDPSNGILTFDGWYTDEECGMPYDFTTAVTAAFTLYAKWVEATNLVFTASLSLKDSIDINIFVNNVTNEMIQQGYKFEYSLDGGATYSQLAFTNCVNATTGKYKFEAVARFSANQMTRVLKYRVVNDGGLPVAQKEYTIKDYCDTALEKGGDALKALCKDLMAYGYYAQLRFPGTASELIDKTDERYSSVIDQVPNVNPDLSAYTVTTEFGNSSIYKATASLSLESWTEFNIYLYGVNEANVTVTVGGAAWPAENIIIQSAGTSDSPKCKVTIKGLRTVDIASQLVIETGDGAVISYSPMAYIRKVLENHGTDENVCKALYNYCMAAKRVFGE